MIPPFFSPRFKIGAVLRFVHQTVDRRGDRPAHQLRVTLRHFLAEHYQEMMDPDYKETEEEFSARLTDFILSLNNDEKFKRALLPADTDLRARSH